MSSCCHLPVSCRSLVNRCGSLGSCKPQNNNNFILYGKWIFLVFFNFTRFESRHISDNNMLSVILDYSYIIRYLCCQNQQQLSFEGVLQSPAKLSKTTCTTPLSAKLPPSTAFKLFLSSSYPQPIRFWKWKNNDPRFLKPIRKLYISYGYDPKPLSLI